MSNFEEVPAMVVRTILLCLLYAFHAVVFADGSVIDKIYHPYVQPGEREIEFRSTIENNSGDVAGDKRIYRLAYGQSFSDRWFGELYLIGIEDDDESFRLKAYELEALWQMTEQGEYSADWGMLFEAEKEHSEEVMELSATLLVEREWRRWTGTANISGVYEFGEDIDDELETVLALQGRYRYRRTLEPAVEMYLGQDTKGLGPVLMGSYSMGGGRQIRWEGGVIFGVDSDTPDETFRIVFEYEF